MRPLLPLNPSCEKLNNRKIHKSPGWGNCRGQSHLLGANPSFIHHNSQSPFAPASQYKLNGECQKAAPPGMLTGVLSRPRRFCQHEYKSAQFGADTVHHQVGRQTAGFTLASNWPFLADPVIHSDLALLHHSLTLACMHASAAEERAREEAIVDCYDGLSHLIKTKVWEYAYSVKFTRGMSSAWKCFNIVVYKDEKNVGENKCRLLYNSLFR